MRDPKQLYKDFKLFFMRFRYYFENSSIDYLSIIEPQERGAWHIHLLARFNDIDKVYISNTDLSKLWRQGFVTIKSLKDVDNIGAYLSAYLSDIELTKDNIPILRDNDLEIKETLIEGQSKKFIKGGGCICTHLASIYIERQME